MRLFKITHANGNERVFEAGAIHELAVSEMRSYIEVTTEKGVWLAQSVEVAEEGKDR